jgi:hypothetical protein
MPKKELRQCTAKSKQTGNRCRKYAVSGYTVCRVHGARGGHPITTGRYSKILRGKVAEKLNLLESGDPTDLLPELQIQRALFSEYLSRFDEYVMLTANDIQRLVNWSEAIGRMVERIVKERNETALTAIEIKYLQTRIVDTVRKFIDDPDTQRAFISALFGVTGTERANVESVNADQRRY